MMVGIKENLKQLQINQGESSKWVFVMSVRNENRFKGVVVLQS